MSDMIGIVQAVLVTCPDIGRHGLWLAGHSDVLLFNSQILQRRKINQYCQAWLNLQLPHCEALITVISSSLHMHLLPAAHARAVSTMQHEN